MKESILLGIKGFIIGIANIIPGVSGGTLAITLGIYERLINVISHFTKNMKENIKFIIPIGIGAVLSLALLSNVISYALEHFRFPTTLFFVGLIVGGIPLLFKKTKGNFGLGNLLTLLVTFSIVMVFAVMDQGNNLVSFANMDLVGYILLFVVGVIAAATMVIPGISGSFMLMLLGYYEPIINTIKDLTHFNNILDNVLVLMPFGIGVLIGIVLIAKLIEYLLDKFETKTYYGIIGFVLASILSILMGIGTASSTLVVLISILVFIAGFAIAYKLGE